MAGLNAQVMVDGSEWRGTNKAAVLLVWSMCSSGGAAILEHNTEVNEKYGMIWGTLLNQDVLWLDVTVDVIVEV